jgi:hypothetical protein
MCNISYSIKELVNGEDKAHWIYKISFLCFWVHVQKQKEESESISKKRISRSKE